MRKKNFTKLFDFMKGFKSYIQKGIEKISLFVLGVLVYSYNVPCSVAYASGTGGTGGTGGNSGADLWNAAIDVIKDYVPKIGLLMILTGIIMYAAGQKEDDGRLKSMGTNTMVAGLMIAGAVVTLADKLKV